MITLPDGCPRGRCDCAPMARIESDDGSTYICAGENDGTARAEPGDDLRLCVVSETTSSMHDCDRRDFSDQLSVLAQAMSVLANREASGGGPE